MSSVTHNELILEDQQIPPNHRFVQTRLGLRIELATENTFLSEVIILDTNGVTVTIHPREWLTGDE